MPHPSVHEFAGDIQAPTILLDPLMDLGRYTLRGPELDDRARRSLLDAIAARQEPDDDIVFCDIEADRFPGMPTLLRQFEAASGGVYPGRPTVKYSRASGATAASESNGVADDGTNERLARFYHATGLSPRTVVGLDPTSLKHTVGVVTGGTDKLYARIRLPEGGAQVWALLHELGHCSMSLVGFTKETTLGPGGPERVLVPATAGLLYRTDVGEWKGTLGEEAVAEGLGVLVNQKLGLVETAGQQPSQARYPDMLAPYFFGEGLLDYDSAAPAAVAFELIAREVGIAPEAYFRMWVNYANIGVYDTAARQVLAETIYEGTRGRLTLGAVDELPYPTTPESTMALLWAVEDSLGLRKDRYGDFFVKTAA